MYVLEKSNKIKQIYFLEDNLAFIVIKIKFGILFKQYNLFKELILKPPSLQV